MRNPSNRFVVLISALLMLLVLGGATLAVGFRNDGWLHAATDAVMEPARTDAEPSRILPTARDPNPSPAVEAGADRRFTEHDDDHRGRSSRQRESDDD